ncbi:hypothetical protein N9Y42_02975 [Mariniblastus sp.]|nr:hypothetical protein [Mariniblastus sp.]
MNGVNQILVIAVGALILLGLMGAVGDANSGGIFQTVTDTVNDLITNSVNGGGTPTP